MQNRCEQRTMADRKVIEPALLLGFCISVRCGPPDEPEDGRHAPLGSETPEILAGWSLPGIYDTIGWEIRANRVAHALAGQAE